MIAGGASFAPSRWSFPEDATLAEEVGVLMDRAQGRHEHGQELEVAFRRFAGVEEVIAFVVRQGPVEVFTAAVYAGERLFVEEADHTMAAGRRSS